MDEKLEKLEKLESENRRLKLLLNDRSHIIDKLNKCFNELIKDMAFEEYMQSKFADSEYDYTDYPIFCKEVCPLLSCRFNCFEKEQQQLCEEKKCDCCQDADICLDANKTIDHEIAEIQASYRD